MFAFGFLGNLGSKEGSREMSCFMWDPFYGSLSGAIPERLDLDNVSQRGRRMRTILT